MEGWGTNPGRSRRRPTGRSGRYGRRSVWSRIPAIVFVLVLLGAGGAIAYVILHDPEPTSSGPVVGPTTTPDEGTQRILDRTFVAWVPGGFEDDAAGKIPTLDGLDHGVAMLSGVAWLDRITDDGEEIDPPPDGMAYPIETAAATPGDYKPFLPAALKDVVPGLAEGDGALSESGSRIRGVGEGALLSFGDVEIEVVAVIPDELMGGHELLVSRKTGERLGFTRDRYALIDPAEGVSSEEIHAEIEAIVPEDTFVEVRGWSAGVPLLRHGDGVSSMAKLKLNFGEFAADPEGGELDPDPAWEEENIETREVPLLGEVTCHRKIFPQLIAGLAAIQGEGVVGSGYAGCYVPRFISHDPTRSLSYHSWGVAIDINAEANAFGAEPDQDTALVESMEAQGFQWGGRWDVPDGMHFEWLYFPAA